MYKEFLTKGTIGYFWDEKNININFFTIQDKYFRNLKCKLLVHFKSKLIF